MPEEQQNGSGVAPEEEQGDPEPQEPEGQTPPGGDESGVEPEAEVEPKRIRDLRGHFHKELDKVRQEFQAGQNQILGALQQMNTQGQTPTQPKEEGSQAGVDLERLRPTFQQDYVKGSQQLAEAVVDQKMGEVEERLAQRILSQQAIQGADERLKTRYPELKDQFDPFYGQVDSRFRELTAGLGTLDRVQQVAYIEAAAAQMALEKPELRLEARTRSAPEEARGRATEARGSQSNVPQGAPRKPKGAEEDLPKPDLEWMKKMGLPTDPDSLKRWGEEAKKVEGLSLYKNLPK